MLISYIKRLSVDYQLVIGLMGKQMKVMLKIILCLMLQLAINIRFLPILSTQYMKLRWTVVWVLLFSVCWTLSFFFFLRMPLSTCKDANGTFDLVEISSSSSQNGRRNYLMKLLQILLIQFTEFSKLLIQFTEFPKYFCTEIMM